MRSQASGLSPRLQQLLSQLPTDPGVYLLKDKQGKVFYVGKAKNLRSRVRSYFRRSGDTRAFVALLNRLLADIETIVTSNDKEALLLENTLIKQYKPRFNVSLRDDKSYLVLRLDPTASYPRLEVTRQMKQDGARYFGPYHSARSCRETLRVVNRYFKLRTCTDHTMATRTRPCLQYQIGRCPAPCVFPVDRDDYQRQVDDVSLFLRGKRETLVESLEARMTTAADTLNFEQAATLRDQLSAVKRSLESQQVVSSEARDQDIFGFHREGDAIDIVVLTLRSGRLVGRRPFSFNRQEFPDREVLSSFIGQYYDAGEYIPDQVFIPLHIEDQQTKKIWLTELRGKTVEILVPQRGDKRRLIDLAKQNARANFATRRQKSSDRQAALEKLQQRLRLNRFPQRIECYDISNLMGELAVGSMVVMIDGEPDRSAYRRFRVRIAEEKPFQDDFSALYQVISRRLRRGSDEQKWAMPDLIVVDGGKGQLSVAAAALRDANLAKENFPDLAALAKERYDEPSASADAPSPLQSADRPDRVFLPHVKDPIRLRPNTAELFLLSQLRDEAHRFAITYHRKLRRRKAFRSSLDDIPGIGPKRKQALLRQLGSLKRIRQASKEELTKVPGMSSRAAEAVSQYFSGSGDKGE